MARRHGYGVSVHLDHEHAALLRGMAERLQTTEAALAAVVLGRAIDDADADRQSIADVLNGIPGALESVARGREQFANGQGVRLDEV